MKKNKRGQFYLIAVLVIIAVFIGLITIANYSKHDSTLDYEKLKEDIKLEKRNVLDYISVTQLSKSETNSTLVNFSNKFIEKIGIDKNIVFILGNSTSIMLVGNKISETSISYNVSGSVEPISETGHFEKELSVTVNPIVIKIDDNEYPFELFDGQNIYYLIKYNYNKEVYIIHD